ncbi:hypothetical protein GHT06_021755 [Daphnia sinensis]|uniref:Ionotropic glutamate receptor L-glutamate and glycine-binding domain-containing protein n=1 Tax=Daphnia sinensis TaxID=1820382 RepID=A0AAD5KHI6_9CRUS|nr:hypothetical protein GHT06_021755 [Daphnia sinensis]
MLRILTVFHYRMNNANLAGSNDWFYQYFILMARAKFAIKILVGMLGHSRLSSSKKTMASSLSHFGKRSLIAAIIVIACFPNYTRSSDSSSILNGQHLRIASLDVRPYMFIDRSGNQTRADGIIYQIIVWLSIRYNFTFSLVLPPDGTFGALVNGSWNGMIGMASKKQVELIAAPVVPSLERARVLDFTTTFIEEPMCCLIPAPEADLNSLSGIAKPYNTYVWLLIIFSMLCVALATWLTSDFGPIQLGLNGITHKRRRRGYKEMSLTDHLYAIFAIICLQPKDMSTHSPNSSPIVLSVWCLACIVLVYLYTGVLISYLTIPKMRPIVETVEELAESTRLQVVAIKNSIFESTLLQSSSGPLKTLGNQLRQHPENSLSGEYYNLELLLQKALLGRFGIMVSKAQAETLIKLDWNAKNLKQCRLSIMREQILSIRSCFALPKASLYTHVIDKGYIRPYMLIEHDLKGKISKADGIVYQMVLWLSKRFNFTFTLVEPPDRTFGAVINNTWNGMIGMTINRDVDFVAGPVIPSEARAQVIDFSVSYLDEPAACLIPAPTLDENKWTAVFKPFHYDVWLIAIVSLVSVAVASWMTMNLYWKWCYDRSDSRGSLRYVLSFDQHVLSALALFFSQGQNTATRAPHSNRIAISSWCLMSTVLVYAYSSCIISYITIPKSHLLVNSIEELANSKILQVATHKNSFFETTLLQSSSGSLKLLGDSLRKNPENSFSGQYYNQTMLLKRVFGRLALLTGRLQLEMLMELNYRQTRRCELTLLPQQFMPILKICLALPKGSPYIHLINLGIIEMKQVGLIDRWIKVYINQTNQCKHGIDFFQHHSNSEIKHPLALSNLAGAFILLLLGVIVATSMFLCEFIFSTKNGKLLICSIPFRYQFSQLIQYCVYL